MEDTYKTIKDSSQGIYKEKGSKFIAYAMPVNSREQIKEYLADIKKSNHSARHYCFAWVIGYNREDYRINDDGEPSGTAGKPIYGQILSKNITNVLIVVVRYFGGVKLGKGGLINAYRKAAAEALKNAVIITKTIRETYRLHFEYPLMSDVMKIFNEHDIEQLERRFELDCTIDFSVRKKDKTKVVALFESLENIKIQHLHTT